MVRMFDHKIGLCLTFRTDLSDTMAWCWFWLQDALPLLDRGILFTYTSAALPTVRDGILASAALSFLVLCEREDPAIHEAAEVAITALNAFKRSIRLGDSRPLLLKRFAVAPSEYSITPEAILIIVTCLQSLTEAGRVTLYPATSTGRLALVIRDICDGQQDPRLTKARLILDDYTYMYETSLEDQNLAEGIASLLAAERRAELASSTPADHFGESPFPYESRSNVLSR